MKALIASDKLILRFGSVLAINVINVLQIPPITYDYSQEESALKPKDFFFILSK